MEVITISRPGKGRRDIDDEDSDIEMGDVGFGRVTDENGLASSVITPGELITDDPIWMRGHGTYFLENKTYSSVAGTISRVNRLLSVIPLRGRYSPETGDHVIGRITEVGQKRWKVDIGAKQDAILMLGSINLPGGVLRRKSESDELQMRNLLKEGDLLNAEVQSVFQDGAASLHTRSLKYGKLRNGYFVSVPSSLIVRSKNHSHALPGNVNVILGVNGYIWLSKPLNSADENLNAVASRTLARSGGTGEGGYTPGAASVSITRIEEESSWEIYSDVNDEIPPAIRERISRYSNCIKALAHCEISINEVRIVEAYEASTTYESTGDLIERETMEAIGEEVLSTEKMRK